MWDGASWSDDLVLPCAPPPPPPGGGGGGGHGGYEEEGLLSNPSVADAFDALVKTSPAVLRGMQGLQIRATTSGPRDLRVEVIDLAGRREQIVVFHLGTGANQVVLPSRSLPPGVHMVRATFMNGTSKVFRVVRLP